MRYSPPKTLAANPRGFGAPIGVVAVLHIWGQTLTFFSPAECNAATALAMQRVNDRPMRKQGVSRRELFQMIERGDQL